MGPWPTKGGPSTTRVPVAPRVGLRERAGPESDSEGEEEFQDSREDPPPKDPMGPPPVQSLGQIRPTSEGHTNVVVLVGSFLKEASVVIQAVEAEAK